MKWSLVVFIFCVNIVCADPKVEWKNVTAQLADGRNVDFETMSLGVLKPASLKQLFPGVMWSEFPHSGKIVSDRGGSTNKLMRISYPKGSVGPQEGGAQFPVKLDPMNECWLRYTVRFSDNFDFRLGGKLPGLTSGGSKFTGGNHPTKGQGWSARYMFRKNGKAVIYLYWIDMPGKYGLDIDLGNLHFVPGKKYTLTQRIKINSDDKPNGVLQVWCNGEKLIDRKDIRFRLGSKGKIDTFYFSTFHGGQGKQWAPQNDCYAEFDDICISSTVLN